ncbi:restriction endonuclease subunit S [Flammeovirga sp. MY04]|uniref:restriction endonuclease subunit S n=1 Tax=Flammeovirga sp. MY04 TaxID=1191459 RepID=UPI0008061D9E|nr:restriction endonuclease subunit S [Flammeovirga sp. MY04]ANQ51429.1 restriction endonuclease subunit S [Flammeovirga sp. MY04]
MTAIKNNIPVLRFPEFSGEWEAKKLSNCIKSLETGVSVNSEDISVDKNEFGILKTSAVSKGLFIEYQNKRIIKDDLKRAKLNPTKDSILISRMNTPELVGESGYISRDYPNLFVPDRLWKVSTYDNTVMKWLSYFLTTPKTRYYISSKATGTSGSMKNISKPSLLSINVVLPKSGEQQKIADFLSSVDKKIGQLEEKKSLLEEYKKGVMQKIFSREIRFKADDGSEFEEWEEKKLGEFMEERSEYPIKDLPLYSLTIEEGIVPKSERYERSFLVKDEKNAYKVMKENDFAFNPMNLRFGALARHKNDFDVSVSKYYNIFFINSRGDAKYFEDFLTSYNMIQYYNKMSTGSLEEKKRVHYLEFIKFKLLIPSLPEQQKIANFLTSLDRKIEVVGKELEGVKEWKKGLLQGMFV